MKLLEKILDKILIFEKEPQKIGLCQIKEEEILPQKTSLKDKDIKLSDLLRRAS